MNTIYIKESTEKDIMGKEIENSRRNIEAVKQKEPKEILELKTII